jgi:hypothetical protein
MKPMVGFCIALLALFMMLGLLHAQTPDTAWTHTYGAANDDGSYSVQQTSDGGYVIAGYTDIPGDGGYGVYLVRTDSLGDTIWTSVIGGDLGDYGRSVQQTQDGGFIVVGYTNSFGGMLDAYMIKTDSDGEVIWTRIYGGNYYDAAYCVDQTSDGGYIFAGYTYSFGISMADVWLVKTDSLGYEEWSQTFGREWNDKGWSVQSTSDGGYILCGDVGKPDGSQMWVIKTDSLGNSLWMEVYCQEGDSHGSSVEEASDSCYIITGYTYNPGSSSIDMCLLKVNALGDTIWTRMYGGNNTDRGFSVQETMDGGFIIGGITWSYGNGYQDIYLVKTDGQGDTLWTRVYGGTGYEAAYSVQQTQDRGYVVTGYTESIGAGGNDVWLLKLEPNVGISEKPELAIPPGAMKLTASPNPFSAVTAIELSGVSEYGGIGVPEIKIYDALGRRVREISLLPFNFSLGITWDGRDDYGKLAAPGVYFVRLRSGDYTASKKVLLVR